MTKKKILKDYRTGKYSTKELSEKHQVTQRYIQLVIEGTELRRYGRTREIPLFTILDLLHISENPEDIEEIIQRGYSRYYEGRSRQNRSRRLDSEKFLVARAKLRSLALDRDNYKCVRCGSSVCLEVHHIKPVKHFPDLELVLDNVETVCHECHERSF